VGFGVVRHAIVPVVFLCFLIYAPYAFGQETTVLSIKPFITQSFNPARNETEIRVILNSNSFSAETSEFKLGGETGTIYGPSKSARVQSDIVLGYASYIYEGRAPLGKQSSSFTFFSERKDTFKDQPPFSIIIDGQSIQDGTTEPPSPLDSKTGYRQKIILIVPTEVFLRIASAKTIQIKIGPKIYKLEGFQQKSIRALTDTIDPHKK
jgi:hypothetical protein